jgi:AraC-like DNA-binding protein
MPAEIDSYAEHQPGPVLRPYVECYWTRCFVLPPTAEDVYRVLPDGCLDIVFNFGDPWVRRSPDEIHLDRERSWVVGTMTRPLLAQSGQQADFLGVRFRPGKAAAFLRMPAGEITDSSAALADVWGSRGRELEGRLFETPKTRQRIHLLEEELLRRLAVDGRQDARVDAAVETVLNRRGAVSTHDLGAACELTRQHLARLFEDYVGISPKHFCRVVRFQELLRRLREESPPDWASLAAELGYYDQAHLIADFKQFTGLTPTAFLRSS